MRAWMALLLAGCIWGPGLESSPRECPASQPVDSGFLVHLNASAPFQGYCLAIADRDADVDDDLALRLVDGDEVYLPVEGTSTYYIHMSVAFAHDKYCADHIGTFHSHPGHGIVEVRVDNMPVCA